MSKTYYDELVERNISPTDARLITDMANHAVQEAVGTLINVVSRLPNNELQTIGILVAFAMLNTHCAQIRDDLPGLIVELMKA